MKGKDVAILGGLALGAGALYLLTRPVQGQPQDGTMASIDAVTTAITGGRIAVNVNFTNTGNVDWTFGVGATLMDANGNDFDMWGNSMELAKSSGGPGGLGIDKKFAASGQTVLHTIGAGVGTQLDSRMAPGPVKLTVAIWQNPTVPPTNRLAVFSIPNAFTISPPAVVAAVINSAAVIEL